MDVDLDELKEVLKERKRQGTTYVKASHLDEMDYSAKKLGHALSRAEERGWVSGEFSVGSGTTYRILVGEDE